VSFAGRTPLPVHGLRGESIMHCNERLHPRPPRRRPPRRFGLQDILYRISLPSAEVVEPVEPVEAVEAVELVEAGACGNDRICCLNQINYHNYNKPPSIGRVGTALPTGTWLRWLIVQSLQQLQRWSNIDQQLNCSLMCQHCCETLVDVVERS
jgi:hypothetical protein